MGYVKLGLLQIRKNWTLKKHKQKVLSLACSQPCSQNWLASKDLFYFFNFQITTRLKFIFFLSE